MIVSWNVRGLNKLGKIKEISSLLLHLQPTISILLETRVKENKAKKVRDKLNMHRSCIDNYSAHPNGRIWILWDDTKVDLKLHSMSSQHLHCGIYTVTGEFLFWLTAIYALNQLDMRRILWRKLENIHTN